MHTTARYFLSLGNVFFSLLLGAVALGFFWLYARRAHALCAALMVNCGP